METSSVSANGTTSIVAAAPTHKKKGRDEWRERGEGGLFKRNGSKNWYVSYYDLNGKQHIESSGTTRKPEAQKILTNRLEAARNGEIPMAAVRKLRYEDIRKVLVADYLASGKLIKQDGETFAAGRKGIFKALDECFSGMAVLSITTDVLRDFVAKRMDNGVSGPTCNRNLALLRRMFMLAKREGKIQNVPYFPMQKESPARKGFVEQAEFEKLREALPGNLRPLVTFLYLTGCRYGAATEIVWAWVKLDEGMIEVPPGVTKNGEALTLPLSAELAGMLRKMFRTDSKPVFDATNFRKEWNKACVKVGLGKQTGKKWYQYSGLIPHDLRRSAVRNSVRAGVEQSTAMSISGHKTISVFQRYNIVDVKDKQAAMEKIERYNASSMLVSVAGGKD